VGIKLGIGVVRLAGTPGLCGSLGFASKLFSFVVSINMGEENLGGRKLLLCCIVPTLSFAFMAFGVSGGMSVVFCNGSLMGMKRRKWMGGMDSEKTNLNSLFKHRADIRVLFLRYRRVYECPLYA